MQKQQAMFRDCWFLAGSVDAIGYSHSLNLGRLAVHRHLRETYTASNTKFESVAYQDVAGRQLDERKRLFDQAIRESCTVIVMATADLVGEEVMSYVEQFPNITFVGPWDSTFPPTQENIATFHLNWFPASFVAGAVAASVSKTCGGFLTTISHQGAVDSSAWSNAMGFVLGYQWQESRTVNKEEDVTAQSNKTLHVVTMEAAIQGQGQVQAARLLIDQK